MNATTKRRIMAWTVAGGLVGAVVGAWAQTAPPTLTEVQRLRVQLQIVQEQLVQAQYQLATCEARDRARSLGETRRSLEREVAPAGYVLDWATLTLKPTPPPAPSGVVPSKEPQP